MTQYITDLGEEPALSSAAVPKPSDFRDIDGVGERLLLKSVMYCDCVMDDSDLLMHDPRGEVIMRQIIRSASSISANFEEGYGQGTTPEFIHSLRISNGEARETKGWYRRSKRFLPGELIQKRMQEVDEVIALNSSMIKSLKNK